MRERWLRMLTEKLDRRPFVPFVIVMSSGDRVEIVSPSMATLDDNQLTYAVPRTNSIVYLRLNQISHFVVNDLWAVAED